MLAEVASLLNRDGNAPLENVSQSGGDGLVFAGVEECDDGGLLIGCTSGCRLAECQRLDTVAKPMSSDDLEMKMMWMQAHQMPQPPSSDLLDMQGYRLCFQFTNDGSGPVSQRCFYCLQR